MTRGAPTWPLTVAALLLLGACERGGAERHSTSSRSGTRGSSPPALGRQGRAEDVREAGRSTLLATVPDGFDLVDAVFEEEGRRVACVLRRGGKMAVLLEGKLGPEFDEVRALAFHRHAGRYAFVGVRGGMEVAVVEHRIGPPYASIGGLGLVADGSAVYSVKKGRGWAVIAGRRERFVEGESDPGLTIAGGGSHVLFREVRAGDGSARMVECSPDLSRCREGEWHDSLDAVRVSADGTRLAYVVGRGGRQALASVDLRRAGLAEEVGPSFDEVILFAISSAGDHLSFLARRDGRVLLVTDGREQPFTVASPLDLVVGAGGRTIFTGIEEDAAVAIVDGVRVGRGYEEVSHPILSDAGPDHAFVAEVDGRSALVVNGHEGPFFDKLVGAKFTPDGGRVLCRARRDGRRFVIEVDVAGRVVREHPAHDAVYDVTFPPGGRTVAYGVGSGRELRWIVAPLGAPTDR